jgi:hypothetical protein
MIGDGMAQVRGILIDGLVGEAQGHILVTVVAAAQMTGAHFLELGFLRRALVVRIGTSWVELAPGRQIGGVWHQATDGL